jgi:hypothetical protein
VTYTSLARLDLTTSDLIEIHETAKRLNALDGISGLLIFNGSRFLQIVEGDEAAIDDLIERLRRDDRHSALEIRDIRFVERRAFPDWSMELVEVNAGHLIASEEIDASLPDNLPDEIEGLIHKMARKIATPLSMPE